MPLMDARWVTPCFNKLAIWTQGYIVRPSVRARPCLKTPQKYKSVFMTPIEPERFAMPFAIVRSRLIWAWKPCVCPMRMAVADLAVGYLTHAALAHPLYQISRELPRAMVWFRHVIYYDCRWMRNQCKATIYRSL